jgi:hypothetical protein
MPYLASNLINSFLKMKYKPIENCHIENTVLGKDLNLGVIGSFCHAFTLQ